MPKERTTMKSFIAMLAVVTAVAFTGSAFAQDAAPSNKADCEAAGGMWNADTSTCADKE
jgi:hypothetical protein